MKRFLLVILLYLFCPLPTVRGQTNQTVLNGTATAAINFSAGCVYNWTNNNPGVGLASSGSGDIPSFIATNNGSSPVTATITAVPIMQDGFAYIASYDGIVTVINTTTQTVTAKIPVGTEPFGISASPDGTRVYVANSGSDDVSVINTATNKVIATIPVGIAPHGISVSPDGSLVYVANSGTLFLSNIGSNTVSVINTAANAVAATITVGLDPVGISTSPNGNLVYVINELPNTISVINTTTNAVVSTITAGANSWGICVSPNGNRIYLANPGSSSVSVINASSNSIIATIPVGKSPCGVSVSPDAGRIYVTDAAAGTLTVIDPATNGILAVIDVDSSPCGVSVSPDGSLVYVADYNSNNISVISTATNTRIFSIPAGSISYSMGNFVTGTVCTGTTVIFTITVNPTPHQGTIPNAPAILIPNAFTPNGDGINDTWDIKNIDAYPNNTVAIFNRYGEKVYSSIGYGIKWDGTFRGNKLPSGTYYYIIDPQNGSKLLAGCVTIIR